jgi:hypothetical protein
MVRWLARGFDFSASSGSVESATKTKIRKLAAISTGML